MNCLYMSSETHLDEGNFLFENLSVGDSFQDSDGICVSTLNPMWLRTEIQYSGQDKTTKVHKAKQRKNKATKGGKK